MSYAPETPPSNPQSPTPPLTALPANGSGRRPRFSLLSGLFRGAFFLVFFISVSLNVLILVLAFTLSDSETPLHRRHHSGKKGAPEKIALIRMEGVILEGLTD